jgi:tellurite resistance protein TehA-like permease
MTINVESGFIQYLFDNVAGMFNGLGSIIAGIFGVIIFAFLTRQILHWIKTMRYY